MAQWFRATVTLPMDSGIPKDAAQNTWAFSAGGAVDRDLAAFEIALRLDGFYTDLVSQWSSSINLSQVSLKVYDMTEERPRYPYYDELMPISGEISSGRNLPSEVAVCLSFQGERTSGVNMRRRRGRVYLGPLQHTENDYDMFPAFWQDAIMDAAQTRLATKGAFLLDWSVYSPSTHFGKAIGEPIVEGDEEEPDFLPASFVPVSTFWVDNAWDTQRRRGPVATLRDTRVAT